LSQHAEEGVFLRQTFAQILPRATAIAGAPDGCLRVRHKAAVNVTVERQEVERLALARMDCRREAEGGRQPLLYALPCPAAVLAAVHAAVVLLVEKIAAARRLHEAVHALAEFGIALVLWHEIGTGAFVARLPRPTTVLSIEDAGRRDADPDAGFVGR